MSTAFVFAAFLALFWSIALACALQFTEKGRWLAIRHTWITVVVGVGVDMLILLIIMPLTIWLESMTVIALSSTALIYRSLHNEHKADSE